MNKHITGAFELWSSCTVDDIQAKIEGNGSKLVFTYNWTERLLNGEKYNRAFIKLYQSLKRLKNGPDYVMIIAWNSTKSKLWIGLSDNQVKSKLVIDSPFKVKEQFTYAKGHAGYKFLRFNEGLKNINLEMMWIRTNFLIPKAKQNDFEVVDKDFTIPNDYEGLNRNHSSNKHKKNGAFQGYNDLFDIDEDLWIDATYNLV